MLPSTLFRKLGLISIVKAFLYAYKGERALVLHDEYDYATTDKELYNKLEFPKEDTNDR